MTTAGAHPELPPAPTELPPAPAELLFRWSELPSVTPELPGVGGVIRQVPEDFRVEELPAYPPSGRGSHMFLHLEKRGLTTRELVRALAAAGIPEAQVGVAGLKDKDAITSQWLSVPNRFAAEALAALEERPGVRLLDAARHGNKLGMGHLRGNRFVVRLRGTSEAAEQRARAVLEALATRGSPNYFGPQRFGRHGANAIDGYRALRGAQVPGDGRLQRFLVSALQSLVFNRILAARIELGLYARVVEGDWARKHDTGGTFLVEDAAYESQRAERLEISATLPLFGRKARASGGEAGRIEARVLEPLDLRWSSFGRRRGDRRSSRVRLDDVACRGVGDGLELAFTLPKGSYATVVLREVMKVDVDAPLPWPPEGREPEASEPPA